MKPKAWLAILVFLPQTARADAYDILLKRYEKQIRQQERQMKSLRANLLEKEREASRWQQKAEGAKTEWSQVSASAAAFQEKADAVRERWLKTRAQADAAEWVVTEQILLSRAAEGQLATLTRELYQRRIAFPRRQPFTVVELAPAFLAERLCGVAQAARQDLSQATEQQAALRLEELRWQDEKQRQVAKLDRLRDKEQAQWARWQEALRRRSRLEEERNQMEQSAEALRVIVQELRDHRDRALTVRQGHVTHPQALAGLKGSLPWPAVGPVTQNFGRQYSSDLNQLLISNGIKIEAGAGKPVRAIQAGQVLFAGTFRQYGQLVIVQHKNGLASVYGGLGRTQVKAGDEAGDLDPIGAVGDSGAFYFELRQEEQPMNPLVYLAPSSAPTDLTSRRKFK